MAKSTPNNSKSGSRTAQDLIAKYDLTGSGDVSESELAMARELLEIELREEKAESQKKMAWTAIISMILFSGLLFSPMVADTRVAALSDLLGLFYLAQAGVVGAYMGFTTWMSRNGH